MKTKTLFAALICAMVFVVNTQAQDSVTPAESRAIAKDAYIFCFPLNYYYRTIHSQILGSK